MLRLLIFLILIPSAIYAEPYKSLPDIKQLSADITNMGARVVLWDKLWESQSAFEKLLGHIESGESEWLEIAYKLLSVSDAGATESILASLSIALTNDPRNVFIMMSTEKNTKTIDIEEVCSDGMLAIFMKDQQLNKWRSKANSAVSKVQDPSLIKIRDRCLKNLSL